MSDAGIVTGVAVAVAGDRIAAVGPQSTSSSARYPRCRRASTAPGGVLTPGLVDSHTHAIFGKPRFEEQELRAAGLDYMEIARRGGGIHASVRDLRTRTEDELVALAAPTAEAPRGIRRHDRRSQVGLRAHAGRRAQDRCA